MSKIWMFIVFFLEIFWSALIGGATWLIWKPAVMPAIAITATLVLFIGLLTYGLCRVAAGADRHIDEATKDLEDRP
jgi:hypothetical protein